MGLVLENPHDGQNSTLVSLKFIYRVQNSAYAIPDWGLGALRIFLDCSLSWSRAAQKENLIQVYQHSTDFSFQPKGKGKNAKHSTTISLQPQNRLSLGHFAKKLP